MIARAIIAAAILTCVLAAQGPAQAAASTDPWKRVPAAPTSCYVDDGYEAKLLLAREEIATEMAKQTEMNAKLKEKFAALDGQEKVQRIQAYMMKDPQAAMEMMQAQQADAASMTSGITSANADEGALRKELETHKARFNSAADAVAESFRSQRTQLVNTKAKATGEGGGFEFASAADRARYLSLFDQENAEYEKLCSTYFGANGTFPAWLNAYRTKVIEKVIDAGTKQDAAVALQMAIMDTPTGGYRSTATLSGVRDYLHEVIQVYTLRRHKATASQVRGPTP